MSKLLILLITFFLLYTFLKKGLKKFFGQMGEPENKEQNPPITDQLVQDPVCGVYCPKQEAITLNIKGKKIYFCSTECRDKFLSKKT